MQDLEGLWGGAKPEVLRHFQPCQGPELGRGPPPYRLCLLQPERRTKGEGGALGWRSPRLELLSSHWLQGTQYR